MYSYFVIHSSLLMIHCFHTKWLWFQYLTDAYDWCFIVNHHQTFLLILCFKLIVADRSKCLFPETCYICHVKINYVGLQNIEECRAAVQVYRALSSPAYLFHGGVEDPILEAFVISDFLEKRKRIDPAYRVSVTLLDLLWISVNRGRNYLLFKKGGKTIVLLRLVNLMLIFWTK